MPGGAVGIVGRNEIEGFVNTGIAGGKRNIILRALTPIALLFVSNFVYAASGDAKSILNRYDKLCGSIRTLVWTEEYRYEEKRGSESVRTVETTTKYQFSREAGKLRREVQTRKTTPPLVRADHWASTSLRNTLSVTGDAEPQSMVMVQAVPDPAWLFNIKRLLSGMILLSASRGNAVVIKAKPARSNGQYPYWELVFNGSGLLVSWKQFGVGGQLISDSEISWADTYGVSLPKVITTHMFSRKVTSTAVHEYHPSEVNALMSSTLFGNQ